MLRIPSIDEAVSLSFSDLAKIVRDELEAVCSGSSDTEEVAMQALIETLKSKLPKAPDRTDSYEDSSCTQRHG